jgi:hypothetical protein
MLIDCAGVGLDRFWKEAFPFRWFWLSTALLPGENFQRCQLLWCLKILRIPKEFGNVTYLPKLLRDLLDIKTGSNNRNIPKEKFATRGRVSKINISTKTGQLESKSSSYLEFLKYVRVRFEYRIYKYRA